MKEIYSMDPIQNFVNKVVEEAPEKVEFTISNTYFSFLKKEPISKINNSLMAYQRVDSDNNNFVFEIRHPQKPGTTFNRIDICVLGRQGQITSFQLLKLGFDREDEIIDITERVRFVSKNKQANKINKQTALKLLSEEGLLDEDNENRWYVGTYSNKEQKWLYGGNTETFITNFLKVGVILGSLREGTGIEFSE